MMGSVRNRQIVPVALLASLVLVLGLSNVFTLLPTGAALPAVLFPNPDSTAEMLLHYTFLPRFVICLLTGLGLGVAGAIMQIILRNPLAEPATLGISAGAYLMLSVSTLYFPFVFIVGREWMALAGAALAMLAIFTLSWRKGFSPVTVTLAGMIVTLYCGAASAVLTLFNHDLLVSIFIWGAGYLDQQDWSGVWFLLPRLIVLFGSTALLIRPMTVLTLDDANARSVGLPLEAYRILALALGAALTAVITASVGVISFVGLAAPALARASGARRTGHYLLWSGLIGALLLTATDQAVLALPVTFRLFPTGAVTALLGAPLLLFLIPRLKMSGPPRTGTLRSTRLRRPLLALSFLVVSLLLAAGAALFFGRGLDGWALTGVSAIQDGWRWPRVLAAFCGGATLALAGAILQRMTGNPMASPEVLGVSSGAMLGVTSLLLIATAPTRTELIAAGTAGACVVLLIMFALSRKPGFANERLLLVGIALGSVSGFVMAVLMSAQDPRLGRLLSWLSGSTYGIGAAEARIAASVLLAGLFIIPLVRRWLELLPLGSEAASAAGVSIALSRNVLLAIAATLTAAATILVGPLSFAGLMGPHLARLWGFQRAGLHLLVSALTGGLILMIADWIGRNIAFPFQIPAGLMAAVVGGPFLLTLIARRS